MRTNLNKNDDENKNEYLFEKINGSIYPMIEGNGVSAAAAAVFSSHSSRVRRGQFSHGDYDNCTDFVQHTGF